MRHKKFWLFQIIVVFFIGWVLLHNREINVAIDSKCEPDGILPSIQASLFATSFWIEQEQALKESINWHRTYRSRKEKLDAEMKQLLETISLPKPATRTKAEILFDKAEELRERANQLEDEAFNTLDEAWSIKLAEERESCLRVIQSKYLD